MLVQKIVLYNIVKDANDGYRETKWRSPCGAPGKQLADLIREDAENAVFPPPT